jgi:hypothetical protein
VKAAWWWFQALILTGPGWPSERPSGPNKGACASLSLGFRETFPARAKRRLPLGGRALRRLTGTLVGAWPGLVLGEFDD